MTDLQKYQSELAALVSDGDDLQRYILLWHSKEGKGNIFEWGERYQGWYTESLRVVGAILPEREVEFSELYAPVSQRKKILPNNFRIQDFLRSYEFYVPVDQDSQAAHFAVTISLLSNQVDILRSAEKYFTSALFEIKTLLQADLFDSELEVARELLSNGFIRAAGVVAGVVLERHLSQVVSNHGLTTRKKNPTIADFNNLLKSGGVLDTPSWRKVQRLGDVRNLCGHEKGREPESEEAEELIDGVEKYTKTLF